MKQQPFAPPIPPHSPGQSMDPRSIIAHAIFRAVMPHIGSPTAHLGAPPTPKVGGMIHQPILTRKP